MKRCDVLVLVAMALVLGCSDSGPGPSGDDAVTGADAPWVDGADNAQPDGGHEIPGTGDTGLGDTAGDSIDLPPADPGCTDCDVNPVDLPLADNPATDVPATDVPAPDVNPSCPGGYLCDCQKNEDCLSGLCVQDVDGLVCSRGCAGQDSCPEGWKCSQMTGTGGDILWVCVNPFSTLCRPCKADSECVPPAVGGNETHACLSHGEKGSFCGRGCATGDDCPRGYACDEMTNAGGLAKFCVPEGGAACACPAYFAEEGFLTTCSVTVAGIGTCHADRTCDEECGAATPAAEACNKRDDDCDGETDEGLSGGSCTNSVPGLGTCTGTFTCVDGEGRCSAPEPKAESCGNGIDDDCDGATDEEGATGCVDHFRDGDGDRYGRDDDSKCLCAAKAPYTTTIGQDCNDEVASLNPGIAEICNKVDDNCDGVTDPVDAGNCTDFFQDGDQDTWGVAGTAQCLCAAAAPLTAVRDGDCDDTDPAVKTGGLEACNGRDDNCDGATDEPDAKDCTLYYRDEDQDTWGVAGTGQCLCAAAPPLTAARDGDCDDADPEVKAGGVESCNGRDDNCDGATDEPDATGCTPYYKDADRDGYGVTTDSRCLCQAAAPYDTTTVGDCNDGSDAIHPGATESCNEVDDDCDGAMNEVNSLGCSAYYLDNDGDTWGVESDSRCLCKVDGKYSATKVGDCNDADGGVYLGAVEVCNGKDDDCDTESDEDGAQGCSFLYQDDDDDTYGLIGSSRCLCASRTPPNFSAIRGQDCNDTDGSVNPGMVETCNGKDDNCSGQIDEPGASGCTTYYLDRDGDGWGSQEPGRCLCEPATDYKVPNSRDCCDLDDQAKPGQAGWFEQANKCGDFDYDCNELPDKEPFPTNGGCKGWPGCGANQGWDDDAPPCGESGNYVTGGCSLSCVYKCCDPSVSSRVQKCH